MTKRYYYGLLKRNFSVATIWISGGSDMDSNNKKGINHILCSLLLKECEGYENLELTDFIEYYGGELNQEVIEDGMLIKIKSLNTHFEKLYPLLDLIINKPILSNIQFQKVKKSTLNLIKKEKENPFNIGFEKWKKIVYSNHPYAFNTIGHEKDVSEISYEDVLKEYEKLKKRKKFLISNNFCINGESIEITDKKIYPRESNQPNHELSNKDRFVSSYNDLNQTIIMIGNQTCSRRDCDYLPLKILESYLSYGMSSVLFKLFREKNGITYDVGVFNPVRKRNSPFLIYLSVSNKNTLMAFELLSKLWRELLSTNISDEEIFLAKEKLKSSFLISRQSIDEILQTNIQLISYGILPNAEKNIFPKIDNISSKNIKELMKKYFEKPFLSVTGNEEVCKEIENRWCINF